MAVHPTCDAYILLPGAHYLGHCRGHSAEVTTYLATVSMHLVRLLFPVSPVLFYLPLPTFKDHTLFVFWMVRGVLATVSATT